VRAGDRPEGIGAGQLADFGTLPSAAIGAELLVALRLPPIRIEIAGAIWGPQKQSIGGGGAGGELTLVSGVAQGCFLPLIARIELGGCIGAGVDGMGADAFGPIARAHGSGAWTVVAGEGNMGFSVLPWLAIRGGIGVHVPLTRPSFVIQGLGQVHRPSSLSGRQSLTLEVRFL
jgi:hypothetical protein